MFVYVITLVGAYLWVVGYIIISVSACLWQVGSHNDTHRYLPLGGGVLSDWHLIPEYQFSVFQIPPVGVVLIAALAVEITEDKKHKVYEKYMIAIQHNGLLT